MFVFIPGSIPPVRFGLGETDSPDGSISPVTYIYTMQLPLGTPGFTTKAKFFKLRPVIFTSRGLWPFKKLLKTQLSKSFPKFRKKKKCKIFFSREEFKWSKGKYVCLYIKHTYL